MLIHLFAHYDKILNEDNRVQHIKDNMETCQICKRVAQTHGTCSAFNNELSAGLFVQAMKEYLEFYESC